MKTQPVDPHKDPTQTNLLDYASDKYLWNTFFITFQPNGVWWFNYQSTIGRAKRWEITKGEADLISGIWNLYHTEIVNSAFRSDYVDQKYIDRAKRRVAEFKSI